MGSASSSHPAFPPSSSRSSTSSLLLNFLSHLLLTLSCVAVWLHDFSSVTVIVHCTPAFRYLSSRLYAPHPRQAKVDISQADIQDISCIPSMFHSLVVQRVMAPVHADGCSVCRRCLCARKELDRSLGIGIGGARDADSGRCDIRRRVDISYALSMRTQKTGAWRSTRMPCVGGYDKLCRP